MKILLDSDDENTYTERKLILFVSLRVPVHKKNTRYPFAINKGYQIPAGELSTVKKISFGVLFMKGANTPRM